ncbi:MAG: 4a-hydroxytetrahydrobiopterin dehydratase [Nevskiales bacterium]
MSDALHNRHCTPCEGGTEPLDTARIQALLKKLKPHWQVEQGATLIAEFDFANYYETTAFVNAVVWIAHREDHHPDISFGYKQCTVRYTTHAINGLSDNDFICAAKIDALLD